MNLARLRLGELLAAAAAVALVVLSFVPWYRGPNGNVDALDVFGLPEVLITLAVLSAFALAAFTVTERTTALPIAAAVWTTLLGALAVLATLVRVLDKPDHATALRPGAWLALAASMAILAGGWQSMRDERTSLYAPAEPEPRRPPL